MTDEVRNRIQQSRSGFLRPVLLFFFTWAGPLHAAPEPPAERYAPLSVRLELERLSPHVYYAQGLAGAATEHEGFISNAGFVVTEDGVVVFDTLGTPALAAKALERIRSVTSQPIRKVVLSHYHADHIYGLQVFKEQGAEIIAPAGALDYLAAEASQARLEERRNSLYPWVNADTRLLPPDELISEPTEFTLGGVTFILTPLGAAHSDGDLMMFVEPDRVLFSGDMIFEGRVPFVGAADTRIWLAALERMRRLELEALIPGHGPAAAEPNQAVSQTQEYLSYLRATMGAAVEKMQDFASAYAQTDWSRFEDLPAFEATNRRNAYSVYLALEEEDLEAL